MILKNEITFGGEVVRKTDFGDGRGGNIIVKGSSSGEEVELSVLLTEDMYKEVCDKKYPVVIVNGHIEQRIHETKTGNIKRSLRFVADDFELVS